MGISFNQVSHIYPGIKRNDGVVAIKDINLNINEEGEFICIVGQTGSGKSTLVQHMNGLLLPTDGTVNIFDNVLTNKKRKNPKLKPVRKRVGFVFQFPEYQLFEETVIKDIIFAPKNFGEDENIAISKAKEVCKELKIDESLLNKSPFNLSGGQMRKVAIAGILSYEPDILLLDEPTRGLDPKGQVEIMDIFYNRFLRNNKSMIVITHDMDLVYKYATRVIVMKNEKLFFDGSAKELFSSNLYKESHLTKPSILKLIDHLNNKLNLNLSYDFKDEDQLLEYLGGEADE